MFEHFPGYGNRKDLYEETCSAAIFVRGVYDQLFEVCDEHIVSWVFDIDDRIPFKQPTTYASIEDLITAAPSKRSHKFLHKQGLGSNVRTLRWVLREVLEQDLVVLEQQ
eukprot:6711646-Prymnesium_polylepis.1